MLMHVDEFRLFLTQRQAVAAEAELNRIAERRAADDFNLRAVAKSHFEQSPAQGRIAACRRPLRQRRLPKTHPDRP